MLNEQKLDDWITRLPENHADAQQSGEAKCAVRADKTGEHCPETPIIQIEKDVLLCEKCFRNYIHLCYPDVDIRMNIDKLVAFWIGVKGDRGQI